MLHFEALQYAEARNITVDAAEREAVEMLRELLPDASITIEYDRIGRVER